MTPGAGNPLLAKGFHPAVWSYGHRNLLGIAFDASGNLWEEEMGPKGGDEVNLILSVRNYGYPIVSTVITMMTSRSRITTRVPSSRSPR